MKDEFTRRTSFAISAAKRRKRRKRRKKRGVNYVWLKAAKALADAQVAQILG